MRLVISAAAVLAAASLVGCAMPASQPGATAAATPHTYQEPDTGSLFGGGNGDGLTNGFHDPGMGGYTHAAGGH